jgi:cold shock CspA family protein
MFMITAQSHNYFKGKKMDTRKHAHREPKSPRLVGKIKWFGGKYDDLGYGFVQVCGDEDDIFIHKKQCKCDVKLLREGTAVTFEKSLNKSKDKYEASHLILFNSERDLTFLERCITGSDMANWIRKNVKMDERITFFLSVLNCGEIESDLYAKVVNELLVCMFSLGCNGEVEWPAIPESVLQNPIFAKHIASQLSNMPEQSVTEEDFFSERSVIDRIRATKDMPTSLKASAVIFPLLPGYEQVTALWDCADSDLPDIWSRLSDSGRAEFASRAVSENKHIAEVLDLLEPRIVPTLPTPVQVGLIWDRTMDELSKWWVVISEEARVQILYRAQAEDSRKAFFASLPIEGVQQSTIQCLISAVLNNESKDAFNVIHERLQEHVIKLAWSNMDPLLFDALLPSCPHERKSKVRYCEGREWFSANDKMKGAARASRAYCPRTGQECSLNQGHPPKGARIYPDTSLLWDSWAMGEMLNSVGVLPALSELRSADEYIPKLCGWINRLNEIRNRLKCSACKEMMKPNYTYAKNLAQYNMTVVSCRHENGHDKNIYINHCWGCGSIIDSRESSIQVESRYICLHCGSGPQKSEKYSQGDICPSCGKGGMSTTDRYGRIFECNSCDHTIWLPPKHRLTGPRKNRASQKNSNWY